MALQEEKLYTIEDIYALPDGERAELVDGHFYSMAPPNTRHQILLSRLNQKIANYIDTKGGTCEVIPAPFAVFLNNDSINYVEPDISVICDKNKLDDRGCNGAPDWIIEIVSPSNQQMDYEIKLFKYRTAGVREYWIVNPMTCIINVYDFENGKNTHQYSFDEDIPVSIYGDLGININELL
ncbi:MAG: Uma2 family endonuclease [Lachnospiraceae bacterium]|jgi:Uma2 family endonuclease|nr:Uma2 family endonuclease [Lachnospiraceae bacterium]